MKHWGFKMKSSKSGNPFYFLISVWQGVTISWKYGYDTSLHNEQLKKEIHFATDEGAKFNNSPEILPYSILPLSITLKDMLNRILHPHDVVRFTLNRIKQCDWFNEDMSKFYVSNHYLGRQPLKIKEGQLERRWKAASGLLKPEVLHKAWVPLKPKARVIRIMKLKKKVGSDQVRPCSALAIGVESARVYSDRVSEESEALPQCTSSFSAVVLQAETRNEREPAAETNDEDEDSNQ